MENKNIPYFIFELKNPRTLILWRRLVLWEKIAATLARHVIENVSCYFRRSLVNSKNGIILFWSIWVIYGSWKSWRSIVFDSEHVKNDLKVTILNPLIRSLSSLIEYQPRFIEKYMPAFRCISSFEKILWKVIRYGYHLFYLLLFYLPRATPLNVQNLLSVAEDFSLEIPDFFFFFFKKI